MNRIFNWSLQFISDTWIFLTCTHLFFSLQAEVSPPRYDEFLLNWNPSLSLWGHRHKKRKNVWTLIEASRLLWESLGISGNLLGTVELLLFFFLNCTNSFMNAADCNMACTYRPVCVCCAWVCVLCVSVLPVNMYTALVLCVACL